MIEKKQEILKNKKINHFQQSELFNDLETGHHQNQACEQYLEKQILNPKILTDKSMTTENNQDQSKIIIKEMIEDNEIKKKETGIAIPNFQIVLTGLFPSMV